MGINIIDKIKPQNNGAFPTYDDIDGYGGFQVRADVTDRDNIPTLNRKAGMLVYTQYEGTYWQLGPGLTNSDWSSAVFPGTLVGAAGGDLSGTFPNPTVAKINGHTVVSQTLGSTEDGYVLTWDNADGYWKAQISPSTTPSGSAGGDLSGTYPNPTVAKINSASVPPGGSLIAGNVLQVAGGSSLSYGAVNLAGGATYVSGVLPAANQAAQTMGGDISGTTSASTVIKLQGNPVQSGALGASQDGYVLTWVNADGYWEAKTVPSTTPTGSAGGDLSGTYPQPSVAKINAASVPAAGSLTVGNVLQVSGVSSLTYGALNLGGGANYVTGTLPAGNQASQSMGGDVSGTTASATVIKLQGNAVQSGVLGATQDGYVLTWVNASSDWEAKPASGGGSPTGSAGGDLSGSYPNPTVAKVNGTSVPASPSANQVLVATNGTTAAWQQIANAQVSSSAAIDGTKISPNFGSQTVQTTGTVQGNTIAVNNGSTVPTVVSGTGAPGSSPPSGSMYLRTDGNSTAAAYVYQGGTWVPLPGAQANTTSSSGSTGYYQGNLSSGTQSSLTTPLVSNATIANLVEDDSHSGYPAADANGVWASSYGAGGLMRYATNSQRVVRVPLDSNAQAASGSFSFVNDKSNNRLYFLDSYGPRLWVIDTTSDNPSGSTLTGVVGPIKTHSLSLVSSILGGDFDGTNLWITTGDTTTSGGASTTLSNINPLPPWNVGVFNITVASATGFTTGSTCTISNIGGSTTFTIGGISGNVLQNCTYASGSTNNMYNAGDSVTSPSVTSGYVYKVDPSSGTMTTYTITGSGAIGTLAYQDGYLWGGGPSNLYKINTSTGAAVGSLAVNIDIQAKDPTHNLIIGISNVASPSLGIAVINTNTTSTVLNANLSIPSPYDLYSGGDIGWTIDSSYNIWILREGTPNKIFQITPTSGVGNWSGGTTIGYVKVIDDNGLYENNPKPMAFASATDGYNLFIANANDNAVWAGEIANTNDVIKKFDIGGIVTWVPTSYRTVSATKTSNYTITSTDDFVTVSTSGSIVTISLPANPVSGETHTIADVGGNVGTNALTISGNGHNVVNASHALVSSFNMANNYDVLTFTYNGTFWSTK